MRETNFDREWRFFRGDSPGAENAAFNDSAWRTLDLPMTGAWKTRRRGPPTKRRRRPGSRRRRAQGRGASFQAVGPFSPAAPGGGAAGYTLGGTGQYANTLCWTNRPPANRLPSSSTASI